jgi:hypothetical protein
LKIEKIFETLRRRVERAARPKERGKRKKKNKNKNKKKHAGFAVMR